MALYHPSSGEVVDLQPLGSAIEHSKTHALVKTESFETIRLIVPSGSKVPPHQVSGRFTLHCLEGKVQVGFGDSCLELSANQWVHFDAGVLHSLDGLQDSSLLLTIMLPVSGGPRANG